MKIMKNMDSAPFYGSMFGQDVEPSGTYVIEKDNDNYEVKKPWVEGTAEIKNPLVIEIDDSTKISYKYELSKQYNAKGKRLTEKLMSKGYDAIITMENGSSNEIVLFPNCRFMLGINETKNLIKKRLTESLTNKLIESYLEEDYPNSFNMEEFKTISIFSKRIQYCEHRLKRISSGSGRIVYIIDDTKVLKLAKNRKGVAQIEVEADWGQQTYFNNLLAHTFDFHPDYLWIEMELARKVTNDDFERLAECKIKDMYEYLDNFYNEINSKQKLYRQLPELVDYLNDNVFTQLVREFIANTNSGAGDFGKLNSYGLVQRNGEDDLVIVDFGLTNNVYDSYYK